MTATGPGAVTPQPAAGKQFGEAPDLGYLFAPRSVAVIGASANPSVISGRPQRILAQHEYPGTVYPVNPRYTEIDGLACYPDIRAVPGPVDVALVVVAAPRVPAVLADAAAAGVRHAIVVSSGFAEQAGGGPQRQLEAVLAAHPELQVLGPNSEGLLTSAGPVPLSFSPAVDYRRGLRRLIPGDVAVVAQSGGLGFALFNDGLDRSLGFSHVVSTGNEAGLDLLDVATYLVEQPGVRVLLAFIEGIRDGNRLHELAARARSLRKPFIAAKVGRSEAARRAALSHTAHLAGDDTAYDAVLRHYGALRATDQEDMVDLALAFARCPPPRGPRVGVVTASGGAGTWMADALSEAGLAVPRLSEQLQSRLRSRIPAYGSSGNPVDVTAQILSTPGGLPLVMADLAESGQVDAIVLVTTLADAEQLSRERDRLADLLRYADVPLIIYTYTRPAPESIELLASLGVPYYTSGRRAARALAALLRYASEPAADLPVVMERACPRLADATPQLASRPRLLTEPRAKDLLRSIGLPVPEGAMAATPSEVAAVAARLGCPVAVKAVSPLLIHKSELGAVVLNVATPQAAAAAAERVAATLAAHPEIPLDGFLVEAMAPPGIEMILGARVDPDLGPLVLVGRGGLDAEIQADTATAPAPLPAADAERLIRRLRCAPLLAGTRGRPAHDLPALTRCLARLSDLAATCATDIGEIDCNPVVVHEDGHGCTLVDALVVTRYGTGRGAQGG